MIETLKLNDEVRISSPADMYDGEGEITGETECFWIVTISVHKTMGQVYGEQKEEIKYFHKKNNLSKFAKHINTDSGFLELSKL